MNTRKQFREELVARCRRFEEIARLGLIDSEVIQVAKRDAYRELFVFMRQAYCDLRDNDLRCYGVICDSSRGLAFPC